MLAPGFFGKVPGRGDFIGRRLPPSIHQPWENWLAELAVAAREGLGEAWPEDWLTAPLWHFSLGAALVPPGGAVGVLVASVDRVGRYFPFSLLGASDGREGYDDTLAAWSRAAEGLILGALDDDFDPDALDAALTALGAPPTAGGVAHRSGQWHLALDGDWPSAAVDQLDDRTRQRPGPDQSAWWCRGSGRMPALHFRCAGLPGPHTTAAMVTGRFDFPED